MPRLKTSWGLIYMARTQSESALRWIVRHVRILSVSVGVLVGTLTVGTAAVAISQPSAAFDLVPTPGAVICLPNAHGSVTVMSKGPVEMMTVNVSRLPPKTNFDLFVIQTPNAPFGISWYQGDIQTNGSGEGTQTFIGRFNIETFVVSPGAVTPPPQVHTGGAFPDAAVGASFGPIHTYHLGLWFDSPADAQSAGCPNAVTPFNGEHAAGIQVLNTANFPADQGPLRQIHP
jgi:hypothetical protein